MGERPKKIMFTNGLPLPSASLSWWREAYRRADKHVQAQGYFKYLGAELEAVVTRSVAVSLVRRAVGPEAP